MVCNRQPLLLAQQLPPKACSHTQYGSLDGQQLWHIEALHSADAVHPATGTSLLPRDILLRVFAFLVRLEACQLEPGP